jgi:maleylacetoacetate isomerase
LLPADPILRGQARAFGAHVAAEMHAITVNRVRSYIETSLGLGEAGAERWTEHWLTRGFEALEATLAGRVHSWPFCFGEEPGWADLHLVPQLGNGRRLGIDVTPYTLLLGVEARCVNLDAFRRAAPEAQVDYPGE